MACSAVWLFLRQRCFELAYSLELLDEATNVSRLAADHIALNSVFFILLETLTKGFCCGCIRHRTTAVAAATSPTGATATNSYLQRPVLLASLLLASIHVQGEKQYRFIRSINQA